MHVFARRDAGFFAYGWQNALGLFSGRISSLKRYMRVALTKTRKSVTFVNLSAAVTFFWGGLHPKHDDGSIFSLCPLTQFLVDKKWVSLVLIKNTWLAPWVTLRFPKISVGAVRGHFFENFQNCWFDFCFFKNLYHNYTGVFGHNRQPFWMV